MDAQNPFTVIENRFEKVEQLLNVLLNTVKNNLDKYQDEIGQLDLAEKVTGLKPSTIYVHVCKNRIPHFKKGGRLYFSRRELEDWIKQGDRGTTKSQQEEKINLFPKYKKTKTKNYEKRSINC